MLFKTVIFIAIIMLIPVSNGSSFALNDRNWNAEDKTNTDTIFEALKETDAGDLKLDTKHRLAESKLKEEKDYILTKSKNGLTHQDRMKNNGGEKKKKERLNKRQVYEVEYLIPDADISRRRSAAAAAARRSSASSAAAIRAAAAAAARRTAALLEESNRQTVAENQEGIDDTIELLDSLRQAAAAASSRSFDDIAARQATATAAGRSFDNTIMRQLSYPRFRNLLARRSESRRQEEDGIEEEPFSESVFNSNDLMRKEDIKNLNFDRAVNNLRDAMDIYDSLETLRDDDPYRDESLDTIRQAATEAAKEAAITVVARQAAATAARAAAVAATARSAAAAAASRRYMYYPNSY